MPGQRSQLVEVREHAVDDQSALDQGAELSRASLASAHSGASPDPPLAGRGLDLDARLRLAPRLEFHAGVDVQLGVRVHLNKATKLVTGERCVEGMVFSDDHRLDVEMIIVSAGIRPRDDLARECGIEVGERGGVPVDNRLRSSDPNIFAVGEVALHGGTVYGLVAPGYEMAEIVAANLSGDRREFTGTDLSCKLKLMGVDVASFGDYEAGPHRARPLVVEDPFAGVYKKLFFNREGTRLLGGILVGNASDYGTLAMLAKSGAVLPCSPGEMMGFGGSGSPALGSVDAMDDEVQVCPCNNVSKGDRKSVV